MVIISTTDNVEDIVVDNVIDCRGNPADKTRTGGWLAAGLILGSELSERICVMGIAMNLVTYLVGNLHLPAAKSATIVTNFMGTLNLLGLFGGFVADAKLGRYLTVAISSSITALGATLLTLATAIPSMSPPSCEDSRRQQCVEANGSQLAMLYVALYTIALGGGGIKSNVSGFGTDQFDSKDPKEEKLMIYFFNRFYFCVSLGSLFAVTVLVYIQDNVGRGWGYGISAGTMAVAVTVLVIGTRFYRYRKPKGSPFTVIWRVVYLAWRNRSIAYPSDPTFLNEYYNAKVPHTDKFRCLDKAAIMEDNATMSQVEEVKMVLKLFPIWSTCILFWTIYSQMNTFSVEQATFMNRYIGSFEIPPGSFSVFLIISILTFTSLNERLFVPFARKFTHNVQGITSLQRVGIGLIFSIISMIAAAIVEKHRRDTDVKHGIKISAFWLVPQFLLVGAGEAFAYVGQLEFFIREAPERMKSMSTGLFMSTLSMGFFVSSFLVSLVDKVSNGTWLRSNLNKGNLDRFYWMLATLVALNFVVFIIFAVKHEYRVQSYAGQNVVEKEMKFKEKIVEEILEA